jgi:hypothetical protein
VCATISRGNGGIATAAAAAEDTIVTIDLYLRKSVKK